MPNPIAFIEIPAQDPRAAAEFYRNVFDWRILDDTYEQYIVFETYPGAGGAFPGADGENYQQGGFIPHIIVEDIDATLQQIEANGGTILAPKTEIPGGVGWWAMFSGPDGGRMAVLKRTAY